MISSSIKISYCVGIAIMSGVFGYFARRALTTFAPLVMDSGKRYSVAFITVPSMEVATTLATGLVKGKMAACVNIIPGVTSIYEWEGSLQNDSELLLMVKTMTNKVDDVSDYIRKNHPYKVAEVISTEIHNGNAPYLKWISDVVGV